MAPSSNLGGKVLLAVVFRKPEDLQLVNDYTELEKEKSVNRVVTRSEQKDLNK